MNVRSSAFATLTSCFALLLGAAPCQAADRILVTMTSGSHGEIKGESANKHGSIEALKFTDEYTLSVSSSVGGGGSGKVNIQDFSFTTKLSKASPQR